MSLPGVVAAGDACISLGLGASLLRRAPDAVNAGGGVALTDSVTRLLAALLALVRAWGRRPGRGSNRTSTLDASGRGAVRGSDVWQRAASGSPPLNRHVPRPVFGPVSSALKNSSMTQRWEPWMDHPGSGHRKPAADGDRVEGGDFSPNDLINHEGRPGRAWALPDEIATSTGGPRYAAVRRWTVSRPALLNGKPRSTDPRSPPSSRRSGCWRTGSRRRERRWRRRTRSR